MLDTIIECNRRMEMKIEEMGGMIEDIRRNHKNERDSLKKKVEE